MFAVNLRPFIGGSFLKLSKNRSTCKCLVSEYAKTRNFNTLLRLYKEDYNISYSINNSTHQITNKRYVVSKSKTKTMPVFGITWRSVIITSIIGGIFIAYVLYAKKKRKESIELQRSRQFGKAKIGGKFELVNQDNEPVKSDDFLGQWLLIYFGFTHCPDICPDEIEKMVEMVELLEKKEPSEIVKPIFISVDPERDSPVVVKKYLKEFSDKIIGLTGTVDQVKQACKAYRVYYSAGPKDEDNDYIVDHTIIIYLVDPDGNFVDYYTKTKSAMEAVTNIQFYMIKNRMNKERGITERLRSIF